MSSALPFEQQFSFESSAVRLDGGTIYQPLRDSQQRYAIETLCGYRMSGSTWEALYECTDGRFVLLQFPTSSGRDCHQIILITCHQVITTSMTCPKVIQVTTILNCHLILLRFRSSFASPGHS